MRFESHRRAKCTCACGRWERLQLSPDLLVRYGERKRGEKTGEKGKWRQKVEGRKGQPSKVTNRN